MSRLIETLPLRPELADAAVEGAGRLLGMIAVLAIAAGLIGASMVNVTSSVDANGWIQSSAIHLVRAPTDGIVASVAVSTGQTVDSGVVLAYLESPSGDIEMRRVRSSLTESRITQAHERELIRIAIQQAVESQTQAAVRKAQARIELSRMEVEYGMPVGLRTDTAPNLSVEAARLAVALADAESRAADLELERALADTLRNTEWDAKISAIVADVHKIEREAQRRVVRAPGKGVVLTSDIEELIGQPVQRGDPLVEIADSDGWRVKLLLDERDARLVTRGQTVRIRLAASDPLADTDLTGVIEGVEGPTLSEGVGSVDVYGRSSMIRVAVAVRDSIGEPPSWVRNGMSVRATIMTGRDRLLWRFVRDLVGSVR